LAGAYARPDSQEEYNCRCSNRNGWREFLTNFLNYFTVKYFAFTFRLSINFSLGCSHLGALIFILCLKL
jgi:hypothetical protein